MLLELLVSDEQQPHVGRADGRGHAPPVRREQRHFAKEIAGVQRRADFGKLDLAVDQNEGRVRLLPFHEHVGPRLQGARAREGF